MSSGTDGEENNDRRGERKTEELFVEHYDFMFATARKILKQKADAEDVIQSLFFKAAGIFLRMSGRIPKATCTGPWLTRALTGKIHVRAGRKTRESRSWK